MSRTRHSSKPEQPSEPQTRSGAPAAGTPAHAAHQRATAPVLRSKSTLQAAATGSTPGQGSHSAVCGCADEGHNQHHQQQQDCQQQQQQQGGLQALLEQLHQLHNAAADAARRLPAQSAIKQQMPAKDAGDDDYPTVECNPAWSPTGLAQAAAATATSLVLQDSSSPWRSTGGTADSTCDTGKWASNSSSHPHTEQASTQHQHRKEHHQQQHKQQQLLQGPLFGVLMLVHEKGVAAAEVWDSWERMQGGKALTYVHLKAGVSTGGLPGEAWINSRVLPTQVPSEWGCISLTVAILPAAAEMLQQHPSLQHIALVSGQDIPVSAVPRDLRPGLSLFGRFQFGKQFDDAARGVAVELLQRPVGYRCAGEQGMG